MQRDRSVWYVVATAMIALIAVTGASAAVGGQLPGAQPQVTAETAGDSAAEANESVESFDVANLSAPSEATVGDVVEVTANVTNPNSVESTQRVEFRLMGELRDRLNVTLDANGTQEITFRLNTSSAAPGEYVHSVLTREHGEVARINLASPTGSNDTETDGGADADALDADGEQAAGNTSVTFEDQTANGSVVTVAEAELSDGGFVVIHDESGAVIGASEYLDPGTHTDVSVEIDAPENDSATLTAMTHRDTDDNQTFEFVESEGAVDRPYTSGDQPVTDDAEVTFE